jgi:hypothetical protein
MDRFVTCLITKQHLLQFHIYVTVESATYLVIMFLTVTSGWGTNCMYCGLDGSVRLQGMAGGGKKEKQNIQRWQTCSNVERWFSMNAKYSVKCIWKERRKYMWILNITSRAWLHKCTHFFSIRDQGYNIMQEQFRTCNNAVWPLRLLPCRFWVDWAAAAYQETYFLLIGHSQNAKINSGANYSKKQYSK